MRCEKIQRIYSLQIKCLYNLLRKVLSCIFC